jgi:ATP-dependent helicase/DNAse subunit B
MVEINYAYQKTVSFSQYSLFNQCPHQWYLKYVKKLKDDSPSIHLIFGTSMHETLQLFFETMYKKTLKKAEELDLVSDFKDRFLKEYKQSLLKNKVQHFSSS